MVHRAFMYVYVVSVSYSDIQLNSNVTDMQPPSAAKSARYFWPFFYIMRKMVVREKSVILDLSAIFGPR